MHQLVLVHVTRPETVRECEKAHVNNLGAFEWGLIVDDGLAGSVMFIRLSLQIR